MYEPGGTVTPLSADSANMDRRAINALLRLSGRDGIEVHRAEAGYVLGLSAELKEDIANPGTGGTGTLNWRGEWNSSNTYEVGDVAIRSTTTTMTNADAGTFVCVQDHSNQEPPAGETMTSAYWETFGRGHWKLIVTRDTADATVGRSVINAGQVIFELDNNDPPTRISLHKNDNGSVAIPAGMVGKTITWREITLCNPDTGAAEDWVVLGAKIS